MLSLAAIARADQPVSYDGSVELRTPLWNNLPGRGFGGSATVRPEIAGTLKLHNLFGSKIVFWTSAEYTFRQTGTIKPEEKWKTGFDLPVNRRLTLFSYFDRRFESNVNRVFVGLRLGFKGRLAD